jgi:hypothetical protein
MKRLKTSELAERNRGGIQMVDQYKLDEIHQRLSRIQQLAAEIEAVPNLLPDLWSMKKIDEKCREIQNHCQWIIAALGTGHGGAHNTGGASSTGRGYGSGG